MRNLIKISVVIPTYNRHYLLKKTVNSWYKVNSFTKFEYEIIFSDDGSTDDSVNFLRSIKNLPIIILENEHGGASAARNAAMKAARGERILFFGDDIFPDPQVLNIHWTKSLLFGSNHAILGQVDWHPKLNVNHLMKHITELGNEQFSYNRLKPGSLTDYRHFYTCNISIPKNLLKKEKNN